MYRPYNIIVLLMAHCHDIIEHINGKCHVVELMINFILRDDMGQVFTTLLYIISLSFLKISFIFNLNK